MDPYQADPTKIPANDAYADLPLYGRYLPRSSDFRVDTRHIRSTTADSLSYWESIVKQCDSSNLLYEDPDDDGRDVFALGTIIVKSSHRKSEIPRRKYSLSDKNEHAAIALARGVLNQIGVQVPEILFIGEINGRDVLIQTRIAGVALNVAWPYLDNGRKASFKAQARQVLRQLSKFHPTPASPSYVVPDNDPVKHRNITEQEQCILFGDSRKHEKTPENNSQENYCLMHNDLQTSNIIVNDDRIVGVIDWEMAGFFGCKRAGAVHQQNRTPKREDFATLNLDEARLIDLTYWNDLYTRLNG